MNSTIEIKANIKKNHELVELIHTIDWPEFIELVMDIRASKVKSKAGKELHYRELLVKNIGVAPVGKARWQVSEKIAESIRRERAQVEGL